MFDLSRLNICFLAGTLGPGGAERQLLYVLKALRDNGTSLRLMCLTRHEFWEKAVGDLNIPITWIGKRQSKYSRVVALVRALRKEPPDVIQSQHFYTNLYAAGAARALGIREIAALRNDCFSEVRANGPVLGRLSLRLPRMLVANSQAAIRTAVTMGVPDARLCLLPNVVDTVLFKPVARDRRDSITLITAGRLVEQKRPDRFLRLLRNLRQHSRTPVKGLVVGDGPLRGELERTAAEMGLLPDVVEFRGVEEDMASAYRNADLLILTSDWEGTPNVVLEAMASGLPVVATSVGGIGEIIKSGETGELTVAGDDAEVMRIVLGLINDSGLRTRLGSSARTFIEANHSLQRLPHRLAAIYEASLS
jgi:glycosyltransferase involved in cell wall biosynthesis